MRITPVGVDHITPRLEMTLLVYGEIIFIVTARGIASDITALAANSEGRYSGGMKTFISYRHTGEKTEDLEPLLSGVCEALASSGVNTYCTFFNQDEFMGQSLGSHEIMQKAFEIIDDSDFLLVIQASEKKSEGMLMEVGYCIAKKIPVVVAVKEGIADTYLPDMAEFVITWKTPEELVGELTAANFAEIIAE